MAKQGYFSGKTEYNKQQKSGGYEKRASGSDTRGYSKRAESEARGYGKRNDNDGHGYGKRPEGEARAQGKPGYRGNDGRGPYYGSKDGQDGGERKPYYGNRQDGEHGGKPTYGRRNDGERRPFDKQDAGERKPYGKRFDDAPKPYERPRDTGVQESEPVALQQGGEDELPFLIIGRNAVREAVRSGRSIDRILVSMEPDGSLREIIGYAKDAKIPVRETARKALDELCMPFGHGGKTANHQGIVAYAAGVQYCDVSDILSLARERNEKPFVVVLDGIMDPHNLGSIIRSAECAGAHGVIIGKRRSASVTAAAVKASAGAVEHVLIARVTNIPAAINELKRAHVWIAGADMGGQPMEKCALEGAIALVIGNEGAGLSKLVSETCDFLVSIPLYGKLDSLNASVAAGVLLYEKKRQDGAGAKKA